MAIKEYYYLAAFWNQRRDSKEGCARRIAEFLSRLRRIDNRFENLRKVGHSIARPVGRPIRKTPDEIARQLEERRRFPELGYMFSSLLPDESISISVTDGVWSQWLNPGNRVFIDFTIALDENLLSFLTVDRLAPILCCVAEIFRPSWGGVMTGDHHDKVGTMGGVPFASWMLYLRQPVERVPSLPAGVEVRPVGKLGVLIITVQERFLADNEDHVRLAADVTKRLSDAGLLDELDCTKMRGSSGAHEEATKE